MDCIPRLATCHASQVRCVFCQINQVTQRGWGNRVLLEPGTLTLYTSHKAYTLRNQGRLEHHFCLYTIHICSLKSPSTVEVVYNTP